MNEARCKECDLLFDKKREWQKFCSAACRTKQFVRTRNEDAALGRKFKAEMNAPSHRDLFAA